MNRDRVYIDKDNYLAFTWGGGAYIDVYAWDGTRAQDLVDHSVPFDNINVWDYESNRAMISDNEFESFCDNWVKDTYLVDY